MTTAIIHNDDFVTRLYTIIDDFLKVSRKIKLAEGKNKGGAPEKLNEAEAITLCCLRWKSRTTSWKAFYYEVLPQYCKYFKKIPCYKNFVQYMHRIAGRALEILLLLQMIVAGKSDGVFFVDSCPIEVCHIKRASSNKVGTGIASRKKSSMGWFYGLKLHAVCNEDHEIVSLQITTASVDDRDPIPALAKQLQGVLIADAGYVGEELREELRKAGIHLFAAPRKNMKKLMSKAQHFLFKKRQSIERVFSVIKTRLGLNCSLARSVNGIFTLLITAVFWYQLNSVILAQVS
jgi:IS5 family transposase